MMQATSGVNLQRQISVGFLLTFVLTYTFAHCHLKQALSENTFK
ncbi:MAG: hypothetical protein JWR72_1401 [Flavisolibacter sp.]|jgi:hypothetical protein|nr:hypothetical protein [Flavisolibacter sp.]